MIVLKRKISMIFIVKRYCYTRKKHLFVFFLIIGFYVTYYTKFRHSETNWIIAASKFKQENDMDNQCQIPNLDVYDQEVTNSKEQKHNITCYDPDWVKCYQSNCSVSKNILNNINEIICTYNDVIYENDYKFSLGPPVHLQDDEIYTLVKSDRVMVTCTGWRNASQLEWSYHATGFRNSVKRISPRLGRENTPNILLIMFDSMSRNGFIRNLPKTYDYLTTVLNATILKGYNIVGEGTSGTLFPILTGKNEFEQPSYLTKKTKKRFLDSLPFIFYKLKKDGYRTAYLEDVQSIGTFQNEFIGFHHQPADHYFRDLNVENVVNGDVESSVNTEMCIGDTPKYQFMLDKTNEFLLLDGKRFCFTYISELTQKGKTIHSLADDAVVDFLQKLKSRDQFRDTILLIMSNHGPRFGVKRNTLQGRLEERLPFMSIILPEELRHRRPDAYTTLQANANGWSTPYDIHTTILDVIDLPKYMNRQKVRGVNIYRGMSLLKPIPKNRTCWEAGIGPHWCTCLTWKKVLVSDPLYKKAANSLIRYINLLTLSMRSKCAVRTLVAIKSVLRLTPNSHILVLKKRDVIKIKKEFYLVSVVSGPDTAVYEASMTYIQKDKRFHIDMANISRTNAYGNQSSCIRADGPYLNIFCYCKIKKTATIVT